MIGAAVHLLTWAMVLALGPWGLAVGLLALSVPGDTRRAGARALCVQGGLWVAGEALLGVLPPVGAWLEPYPWLDVVRVSGMWTAQEPAWAGGSTWALHAAAGGSLVVAWLSAVWMSGPWLAWSAWHGEAGPRSVGASAAREAAALGAWWSTGVGAWLLGAAVSLVVPSDIGHGVVRVISWAWLPFTGALMVRTAMVLPRLGVAAGWLRPVVLAGGRP